MRAVVAVDLKGAAMLFMFFVVLEVHAFDHQYLISVIQYPMIL